MVVVPRVENVLVAKGIQREFVEDGERLVEFRLELELPLPLDTRRRQNQHPSCKPAGAQLLDDHASLDRLAEPDFVTEQETVGVVHHDAMDDRDLIGLKIDAGVGEGDEVVVPIPRPEIGGHGAQVELLRQVDLSVPEAVHGIGQLGGAEVHLRDLLPPSVRPRDGPFGILGGHGFREHNAGDPVTGSPPRHAVSHLERSGDDHARTDADRVAVAVVEHDGGVRPFDPLHVPVALQRRAADAATRANRGDGLARHAAPILMVNREQREAVGDAGMKLYENQLGTGPWIRNTFDPGVYAKVDRNPNYFEMGVDGQPLPYMDNIELIALSREAYEGAFIAGEVDQVSFGTGLSLTEAESLRGQMGDRIDFRRKLHSAIEETHMHTQKAPFNDARVRKAVHLIINRELSLNPLGPGSGVLMGPVPQNFVPQAFTEEELLQMPGWREDKEQDIADAIALMNAAGVGVGADETITINTPIQCPCHATGIKEDVAALGLNLELETATGADYFAERSQGNFIMNIGLEVGGTDPDTYLFHRFHTGAPFNRTAFSDPEVDRLLEKQRALLDPEERADAIREASLALIEHSPQAFTAQLVFWPVSRSYVMGHPDAVPAGLVHQVQEHHRPVGDAQYLQDEMEIAFEAGGVDHRHGDVGPPEEQEVARHLFVGAARLQRVGARQVHELDAGASVGERALGSHDGLARPVAGVLPQAGQRVENGALADVGVAGEGDQHVPAVGAQTEPHQVLGPVLRAPAEPGRQPAGPGLRHVASRDAGASGVSIQICFACAPRSAIRAPRMR